MLDQNTDRSWWMIGSLVVGGAIIGVAAIAFPEVFGTVIDLFKGEIPTGI